MTRSIRRKSAVAGVLLAAVTLAVTACSGNTALPGSDASSTASGDSVLAGAPVAKADLILSGSTMEKIKKRGKLIVAEALDAPLLSQQDPTDPQKVNGFDAELAKLLAIYIIGKPNVEIVPPASETREAMLQNDTVDVVFNTYTITEERAKQVDFAGPYFESGLAVAVKSDNKDIKSYKDLDGKNVIVGANTPAVTEVPKIAPKATVTAFGTDPAAVQALIQGRGDAYVQDYTLLASDAASEKQIKVVGQPFTKEPYGIGLKHGDDDFKKFVNEWLKTIQKDGQWGKAWKTTLGTVTDSDIPTPPEIGSVPGS
ncbi:glutamate transport system substrate-binding protein [Leifsonia sp. 98AMF]|uniref:glutamate ABC transporter substrate-binding protein n=1 Tax=unclassified Leifsonia TaxID=2663824 RepID=UPI0003805B2E|nr:MULTISPECIES: glutamate ABC transporter substrate-binding protein [unclassified Leifsonia]TDQ02193.1 glutamate transport system substrate-binding protein [Leifsonia sp. 115AMFTsu3.1]SDH05531.1 glutamate transport system substrate-binding protein [Leifsonia sp. 197AMF]SDJ35042.1 glutamate transport system substrate-binding protein [Leifsonia sp. 466MF]SDK44718.1 glutamate transport system substrate-binding protein [Leifsonia sp. 157MF]SDN55725.1 glutamate transport system substrate-binding p